MNTSWQKYKKIFRTSLEKFPNKICNAGILSRMIALYPALSIFEMRSFGHVFFLGDLCEVFEKHEFFVYVLICKISFLQFWKKTIHHCQKDFSSKFGSSRQRHVVITCFSLIEMILSPLASFFVRVVRL